MQYCYCLLRWLLVVSIHHSLSQHRSNWVCADPGSGLTCKPGWLMLHQNCYLQHDGQLPWEEAKSKCEQTPGADLVSFGSRAEYEAVINWTDKHWNDRYYWVGLSRTPDSWLWLDGVNFDSSITPWGRGQPDNGNNPSENCGEIRNNHSLNDAPCSIEKFFICEMIPGSEQTCKPGWSMLHQNCYRPYEEKASYQDARSKCEETPGADMVSMGSRAEYEAIINWTDKYWSDHRYWVGLYKSQSSWLWLDGVNFDSHITPWIPGEPNNYGYSEEHCGELRGDGTLNDFVCSQKISFICEMTPGSGLTCKPEWSLLHQSCYQRHAEKLGWEEARSKCEETLGAYLVSIGSQAEYEAVFNWTDKNWKNSNYWVGLNKIQYPWLWVDGLNFDAHITPWNPGEPSNEYPGENCGEIRGQGRLNKANCTVARPFICEMTPDCSAGWYGEDCTQRCSVGCSNVCNGTDGRCQCKEGWSNDFCTVADHHDVTCGPMDISFSIAASDLEFEPENVTLSDPRCHVHTTPSRLTGRTPLNACGTLLQLTNESLVFSNFLILPPRPAKNNSRSNIQQVIPIECRYARVSQLRLSYLPMMRQILFTESGVGQFQFRIDQYRDAAFASVIAESAYPVKVTPGETVFLQLSLGESVLDRSFGKGDKDEGQHQRYWMEVETCVSSPSPSMLAIHNHSNQELIRDSCPANPQVWLIANSQWQNLAQNSSGPHHYFRFSFKPVVFSLDMDNASPSSSSSSMGLAYIHCRVRLCATQACQPLKECAPDGQSSPSYTSPPSSSGSGRKKRAAISELETMNLYAARGGHQLSTGPLLIMTKADEAPKSATSVLSSPVVIMLGAVAGLTTLIAVSVSMAWLLTRLRQKRSCDLTAPNPQY